MPTSDSGIVIDTDGTRPTSKSSIEEVRLIVFHHFCASLIQSKHVLEKAGGKKIEIIYACFDLLLCSLSC